MSIQEQRRKAFEVWVTDGGKYPKAARLSSDGEYALMSTYQNWLTWNAALDSVVIELPEEVQIDVGMIDSVGFFEADEVRDAIEAVGLKVKP